VASILLATDGMLDGVIQPILVNLPPDRMSLVKGGFKKDNVYVTAAEFFMNPYTVYINKKVKNPNQYMLEFLSGDLARKDQNVFLKYMTNAYINLLGKDETKKIIKQIKKYFYMVWAVKNVVDDKSVVGIMNDKEKIMPKDVNFYREPNWKWRQEYYEALLYGYPEPEKPDDDVLN
jgi:hypothetical protein